MSAYKAFTDSPSWPLPATIAESSRVINFRHEPLKSGGGKNQYALLRQPGTTLYVDTGIAGAVFTRAAIITPPGEDFAVFPTLIGAGINSRLFHVIGASLVEIGGPPTKTVTDWSTSLGTPIVNDNARAYMAASPTQLAIVAAGHLYVFDLTLNTIAEVTVGLVGVPIGIAYLDGFFVLIFKNSRQYQISAANDATSWDATQVTPISSRPDYILGVRELKERLWFFGTSLTEPVYNAGASPFPFLSDVSSVSSVGLLAPASLDQLEDTLFLLSTNKSGQPSVVKVEGGQVQEIGNAALDAVLESYQNPTRAFGWCYEEGGHSCYRITFPDIDGNGTSRTWEYDDSLGPIMGWTEAPYYRNGQQEAHLGATAINAFGMILIGDRQSAKIYELSSDYLDDNGAPIYRQKDDPHIYASGKRIYLDRLEYDGKKGLGLNVAQGASYWEAKSTLMVSYDGGNSFTYTTQINWGRRGQVSIKPGKSGLGSGYDIVLRHIFTDPVDWQLTGCDLAMAEGMS
jgi:hypothetical protein